MVYIPFIRFLLLFPQKLIKLVGRPKIDGNSTHNLQLFSLCLSVCPFIFLSASFQCLTSKQRTYIIVVDVATVLAIVKLMLWFGVRNSIRPAKHTDPAISKVFLMANREVR